MACIVLGIPCWNSLLEAVLMLLTATAAVAAAAVTAAATRLDY